MTPTLAVLRWKKSNPLLLFRARASCPCTRTCWWYLVYPVRFVRKPKMFCVRIYRSVSYGQTVELPSQTGTDVK